MSEGVVLRGAGSWPWRLSPTATMVLVTVLAAVLRFYHLDYQSAWLDEVSSLRNARAFGAGGFTGLARADQVAPLHSITLWLMTLIGSDREFWLRLPSALAGIATVPLLYLMGRRMFASPWIGVIAAALVAISPYAIWYSQEGRMYALLLVCTVAFAVLSWPVQSRALRPLELAALLLVSAAGYGMHHYMVLMVGAFGLFLLVQGRLFTPRAFAWLAVQALAFLTLAIWLYLTRDKIGVAGTPKPSFALWIPYTFYTYLVGFSFGPSTREIQAGAQFPVIFLRHAPAMALAGLSSAVLILAGLRRAIAQEHRGAGHWLLIWLIAPIVIAVLATQVTSIRYNVRYVIACFPALCLLLALAMHDAAVRLRDPARRSRWTWLAVAASPVLLGCMLVSLVQHYADPRYAKEDGRALAQAVARLPAGVLLASDNNRAVKVLNYYRAPIPPLPLQVDYRYHQASPVNVAENLLRASRAGPREIALIEYRTWEGDPDATLRRCLDRFAGPFAVEAFAGASLRRYRGLAFGPGDPAGSLPCRFSRSRL
jgi:4-amino-4-deoxy-L-arabinose transferase-like glycosyltransferase